MDWQDAGVVTHTFTHFHLNLRVMVGHGAKALRGEFHGRNAFSPQDLPTLMRKAYDQALRHSGA
jgi:A/G-specific adenine glycosylase